MSTDYSWDQYLEFIETIPVPREDLDYFSSLPWVRPYLDEASSYKAIPFLPRYEKKDASDQFFAKTIRTHDTVPHLLALIHKKGWEAQATAAKSNSSKDKQLTKHSFQPPAEPEVLLFVHVESGLNGFSQTVHGGVLSTLFDEAFGNCLEIHRQRMSGDQGNIYTANLNVSFRAPVSTPSVLLLRTWLEALEGRKWLLRAQMVKEDGEVMAEAEALFVRPKSSSSL